MTIRIVTDSTTDIPPAIAAELGITIIPNYINVGEESFLDGVDLTRQQFYERLPHWRTSPSTAAPGIIAFQAAYERLSAEGASAIISMHVHGKLSNLTNVARLAAESAHSVPVTVVPGAFLALGGGFAAMAAARAARMGASLAEVLALIQDMSARTYIFAALETLEYLRRSGRVPYLVAHLGSWLQILPVLKIHLEAVDMDPVRTRKSGVRRLIGLVEGLGPLEHLGIVHANAPQYVTEVRQAAAHLFPANEEPLVVDITPIIGVHVGPGAVGLVAVQGK